MVLNRVINMNNLNDPYGSVISRFAKLEFPSRIAQGSDLVDVLTEEVFGTRNTRYGPKPSVESQVMIRDVLRGKVVQGKPIPFMVPWGSEKPSGGGVDIAELGALKMMKCLSDRISAHYEPGAVFRVRFEDASAPYLFYEEPDVAWNRAREYVEQMEKVMRVLGIGTVHSAAESLYTTVPLFNAKADVILPSMEDYISALVMGQHDIAWEGLRWLECKGWKGAISVDTVNHFMHQYARLYPLKSVVERVHVLARYYASAWARMQLGVRGDDPKWDGQFLDLAFVPPVPGTEGKFMKRVYYRTLPMDYTSLHIAPWRAKGYLEIDEQTDVTPKLMGSSGSKEVLLQPYELELTNGKERVCIQADYTLV